MMLKGKSIGRSKFQNKHGKRNTLAYRTWDGMIQRCSNKNHIYYSEYGGRGIKICKEWKESFIAFYKYVSKLPNYTDSLAHKCLSEKYSLDRIDVHKGYEPGNVRWVKFKNQVYNRRKSSTNKTGFVGVFWYERYNAFQAKICVDRKQIHLGYFNELQDAVKARDNYIKSNNLQHKLSHEYKS